MAEGTLAGSPETDILVVGAGPTGLLAANLLARSGVGVRILDRNPEQAKESRAFGVQARTVELFHSLGLADALLDRGTLASGAQIFVDGKPAAEFGFDDLGRADTPFPIVLLLPQSEMETILVEDLGRLGVEVERGVEALELAQTAEMASLRVRRPDGGKAEIRARYVIGADGAHSLVRKALGLSFEGAAYAQSFLLADCRVEWPLDHSRFKVFLHHDQFAMFFPLKGRNWSRIIATDTEVSGAASRPQGSAPLALEEVEAGLRRATNIDVRLSDPVWTSRYRVHHRGVDRYRVGRAFVAGDAAHIHSPAGAQGMNTGLQDAANLAWKLVRVLKAGAPEVLLDSYHDERWPVGDHVLRYTDRAFSFLTSQSRWVEALRDRLLPLFGQTVARSGMVRARAFHFVSQLGIRYEQGRFVADGSSATASKAWRRGVKPGHRAPDAAISHRLRVFDLVGGYGFHLLALSRRPLPEEEIARLSAELAAFADGAGLAIQVHLVAHSLIGRDPRLIQAETGEVFEAYGLEADTTQALFVVRPDGYIAWRCDTLDLAACRDFIAQAFETARGA